VILHIRGHSIEHICHHFWVGATANPPISDDRYAQLIRGAFIMNDFLQNPHFRKMNNKGKIPKNDKRAVELWLK
jgi:hypothetical protein